MHSSRTWSPAACSSNRLVATSKLRVSFSSSGAAASRLVLDLDLSSAVAAFLTSLMRSRTAAKADAASKHTT